MSTVDKLLDPKINERKRKKKYFNNPVNTFREFILEYNILPISIGFVIGFTIREYILSLVKNIFMPFLKLWMTWDIVLSKKYKISLPVGELVLDTVYVILVFFVLYIIIELILKRIIVGEKEVEKKKQVEKVVKDKIVKAVTDSSELISSIKTNSED